MALLIYSAIASLDGYVEDASGSFEWAAPDEEVHSFVNDLERAVGTYLCGRRMYDTMRYWETAHERPHQLQVVLDFARIWRAAEKIVYSRSLTSASTAHTRIERDFDPAAVRERIAHADHDMTIGGAELAGQALRAGIVGRLDLFVVPVAVGAGKRCLPAGVRLNLALRDMHRFSSGVVFLSYSIQR